MLSFLLLIALFHKVIATFNLDLTFYIFYMLKNYYQNNLMFFELNNVNIVLFVNNLDQNFKTLFINNNYINFYFISFIYKLK